MQVGSYTKDFSWARNGTGVRKAETERHSLSLERAQACLLEVVAVIHSLNAGQTLHTPSFDLYNTARKVLLLTPFNSTKPRFPHLFIDLPGVTWLMSEC